MSNEAGAGAGQDDGQAGSGAPAGGSSEDGSEKDDKPITAKQLKAALENQRRHYESRLEGQSRELEAFKAGAATKEKPVETPKRYTRGELKAAVDASQITQEQADEVWAKQIESSAIENATAAATAAVAGRTHKERIEADLASYKRLKPEILQPGETRDKIVEEFNYLKSIGDPGTLETELKAIRAVLGSLDKLEKASSARRSQESEEQGGAGGDGRPRGGSSKKLVDHLSTDVKKTYEARIKSGLYKDWDAVEKELKYASPNVRQRLGLPAA